MKKIMIFIVLSLISLSLISQNKIHLIEGDSVIDVYKISKKIYGGEIKYLPNKQAGQYKGIPLNKVDFVLIKKKNYGTSKSALIYVKKDFFFDEKTKRGALDACRNYNRYGGAETAAFLTTLLTGWAIGAISTGIISSVTPRTKNLMMPETSLKQDPIYIGAYKKQSKIIKGGNAWNNWAYGFLASTLISIPIILLME